MFLVSTTQDQAMNTFCEHHQNSIRFGYRCFDRILLNGLIEPFQQPERVIGFFNAIARANDSRETVYAISPSNFRTGSRTVAKNGASLFWMRRRAGAMTLSIPTLSRPRPMR
jgi:hypothetical protein